MEKKNKQIIWICSTFLMFISICVIYITHKAVPFMMDDEWYSTNLATGEPLSGFKDIVESQVWHYLNWGGRSIAHGLLQIILMMGEYVADILNVLVTLLLTWIICVVSGYRGLPAYFAGFAMLFGLNANWKMSMFWQAGAANYLYITVFILLFLYCYLREIQDTQIFIAKQSLPGITYWITPLGIVAGWSNENMGPAVWIITVGVCILLKRDSKKVRLWMVLGSMGCLLGSILVILAPGNFVRSAQVATNEYGVLWQLFLRCYAESQAALVYLFPTLLLLISVLFMSKGILKLYIGKRNCLLLLGAVLSWGAMILSPHYPDRATFGTMVLMICVILSTVRDILSVRKDLKLYFWFSAFLVWLHGMFYLGEFLAILWGWIL